MSYNFNQFDFSGIAFVINKHELQHKILLISQNVLNLVCHILSCFGKCGVWKETIASGALGIALILSITNALIYIQQQRRGERCKIKNCIIHFICALIHEVAAFSLFLLIQFDMEQYKIELSHVDCITDRQGYWLKAITVGITILIIILHARSVQLIADNIHYDYD